MEMNAGHTFRSLKCDIEPGHTLPRYAGHNPLDDVTGSDKCPKCGADLIPYATHHSEDGAIVGWYFRCKNCNEKYFTDEPKEES